MNVKRPGRWPARSISSCRSLSNRQSSGVCSSVPVNLIGATEIRVQEAVQFNGSALKPGCDAARGRGSTAAV
jgi:hypothetical protein